jgi:glycosyltransferase involved in cell wall biosynthesis
MTIGIPFYNAEAYLGDAIRSIFAQTYHDWELILVDDGSTDRSLEIARAVRDPRVRVISDGQNRRLPYRLNQITAVPIFSDAWTPTI